MMEMVGVVIYNSEGEEKNMKLYALKELKSEV